MIFSRLLKFLVFCKARKQTNELGVYFSLDINQQKGNLG